MNYIFGILINIAGLASLILIVTVPVTFFILFPLWGLELWKEDKNTLNAKDWEDYNKYAKDDDTITPKQWRKYGYAYKQWYLNSQRNLPFWTWYKKMRKKSWYMVNSWKYKR